MNVSTDSQVDFVLSVSDETDDTDAESMENEAQHVDDAPVVQEVNAVADGAHGGGDPPATSAVGTTSGGLVAAAASATTSSATGPTAPTGGASTSAGVNGSATANDGDGGPTTTAVYVTAGIAPGDGDLMPPRYDGNRQTDAEDWLQDLLDYMRIRQVPKATGLILLRNRLTGVARKWLESVPPGSDFDETVRRFRARFGDNEGARNELLNQFWHRRQGPDEPAGTYIEEMASLARRMKLDSEPLMRQGIIQGLRPEIQRDVKVQKPATFEALAEAAAIGEANAKSTAARHKTSDAAVSSQLAEMRAMMAVMQDMMTANQGPSVGVRTIDAPTSRSQQPGGKTTTATAETAPRLPSTMASAVVPSATGTDGAHMTIQLVMPETASAQYTGERGGYGGRPGRGRGRGWRGRPAAYRTEQRLNAAAPAFQPNNGAPTDGPRATDNATNNPPCHLCARRHPGGDCAAAHAYCYQCGGLGHFARCCISRQNAADRP